MKAGPDIAMVASLVGDPARANMLTALMTGRALTASELAQEAGITPQTASSHLAKLEAGGLVEPPLQVRKQGERVELGAGVGRVTSKPDVLADGEAGKHAAIIRNEGDAGARKRARITRRDQLSGETNLAADPIRQSHQDSQERGLAHAIASEHRHRLPRVDL